MRVTLCVLLLQVLPTDMFKMFIEDRLNKRVDYCVCYTVCVTVTGSADRHVEDVHRRSFDVHRRSFERACGLLCVLHCVCYCYRFC